ncbi:Pet127-domain-containing protein [Lichtheimia hyalospora FSU 10163]|nr:Pet127-domain-containing protein [Lichtheimia hyalospora FSU 10163]
MYLSKQCRARLLHASLRHTQRHSRSKPTRNHGSILTHPKCDLHCTTTRFDSGDTKLSERLNDKETSTAYHGSTVEEVLGCSEQEVDPKTTENDALRNHIMNQFTEHLQTRKEKNTIVIKKHQPGQSTDIKHVLAQHHATTSPDPHYHVINPKRRYTPIVLDGDNQPQPPTLAHGLDRVLFNPGVHYLKDPRTQVYNFTSFLENITQPAEFDYDSIGPYITPSQDEASGIIQNKEQGQITNTCHYTFQYLIQSARDHNSRYVGSTSSVSAMLSQIYFALSNGKPTDTSVLSRAYVYEPSKYTRANRIPASVFLHWKDGVYGIDADKSFDVEETILSIMGKSMEKVLTLEPPEYERYLKNAESPLSPQEVNQPECFAYGVFGKILLRSQLDCQDPRLPRKTFDLKTRATVPVRLDVHNYQDYLGYNLRRSHGLYESFEREYYDMMRSAFLKYNFQLRIGNMDGLLVTYHNTQQIFGFQYISREEISARLFGNTHMGDMVLDRTLQLFHHILDVATKKYPKRTLRLYFDAGSGVPYQKLNVYVEPMPKPGESPAEEAVDEFFTTESTTDVVTKYVLHIQSTVNDTPVTDDQFVQAVRKPWQWQTKYRLEEIPKSQGVLDQVKLIRKEQMNLYNRSVSESFIRYLRRLSRYDQQ